MRKKITVTALSFLAIFILIVKTEVVTLAAVKTLMLCATSVIPALFPFFVLTGFMVNSGVITTLGRFLSSFADKVFKTSGTGAVVFVIGILCGYPTGAKVISELYLLGKLSKDESERLLAFCNNSGPLFVIGAVGFGMLGNKNIGILIYCIHVLSAIVTGVFLSLFAKKEEKIVSISDASQPISVAFTKSVESAVKSILNVCGYVLLFGCIISVISPYIPSVFINSLFEVTVGAKNITISGLSNNDMLVLLSGAIGFGGLCVYFQIKGAVEKAKLSCVCYLFGKTLQMTLSMAFMKIYLAFNEDITVFAPVSKPHITFQVSYVILFVFLLCSVFTLRRLTKKS